MKLQRIFFKDTIKKCNNQDKAIIVRESMIKKKFVISRGIVFSKGGRHMGYAEDAIFTNKVILLPVDEVLDEVAIDSPATMYLGKTYVGNPDKINKFLASIDPTDVVIYCGPDLSLFIKDIEKKCKYLNVYCHDFEINGVRCRFSEGYIRGEEAFLGAFGIVFRMYGITWSVCYKDSKGETVLKDIEGKQLLNFDDEGVTYEKI